MFIALVLFCCSDVLQLIIPRMKLQFLKTDTPSAYLAIQPCRIRTQTYLCVLCLVLKYVLVYFCKQSRAASISHMQFIIVIHLLILCHQKYKCGIYKCSPSRLDLVKNKQWQHLPRNKFLRSWLELQIYSCLDPTLLLWALFILFSSNFLIRKYYYLSQKCLGYIIPQRNIHWTYPQKLHSLLDRISFVKACWWH